MIEDVNENDSQKIKNILYNKEKDLSKLLKFNENEKILLIDYIIKINQKKNKQKRIFILTNFYLYNIGSGINILKIFFSKVVKRKIDINKIDYIIVSNLSNQIILKIEEEYDYYLNYDNLEDLIQHLIKLKTRQNFKICYIQDIDLYNYTKYEISENCQNLSYKEVLDLKTYRIIKKKFVYKNECFKKLIHFYSKEIFDMSTVKDLKFNFKISNKYNLYEIIINKEKSFKTAIYNLKDVFENNIENYCKLFNKVNNRYLIKFDYVLKIDSLFLVMVNKMNMFSIKKNINKFKHNDNFSIFILINLLEFTNIMFNINFFTFDLSINNLYLLNSELKIINYFENYILKNKLLNKNNENYIKSKEIYLFRICLIIYKIFTNKNFQLDNNEFLNINTSKYEVLKLLKPVLVPFEKKVSFEEFYNMNAIAEHRRNNNLSESNKKLIK